MTFTESAVYHTGDINLASALMALGIPLDPLNPVSLIDNLGQDYGSFALAACSEDGTEDTARLMDHWSGIIMLPLNHGFSIICEFIKARPRGVQRTDDVLAFAVDYLIQRGETLPGLRTIHDVPAFVSALPEGFASYVLAYVWNRNLCFKLYNSASRKVFYSETDGNETRRALIDRRLPKWQAKELISRLQG